MWLKRAFKWVSLSDQFPIFRQILWIDIIHPVLWERALIGYFWNLMFSHIWFGIFGFFCWIILYISSHYIYNLSDIEFDSPVSRSAKSLTKNFNRWSLPDLTLSKHTVHNIKLPFPAFLFFQFKNYFWYKKFFFELKIFIF